MPAALRGGDALVLEDGRLIEVVAAPEPADRSAAAIRTIWCGSPGILVTGICRRRLAAKACASAVTTDRGDGEGLARASSRSKRRSIPKAAPAPKVMRTPSTIWRMITVIIITMVASIMTTTTAMTSIATTTITITTIPMLMTMRACAARGAMTEGEAAALYRSDDLAVAGLSGWRFRLFQRHRMGGGDRRHQGRGFLLRDWLTAMLAEGSGFCDGVFLVQAHRAAPLRDDTGLREIAELAAAFVPSRERQLETTTQGRAFIDYRARAWNFAGLDELIAACDGPIVYPVAVALVSAAHGISLELALHALFHAVVSN